MRWSIRIARIAGIEVKIHVTFFLLLAWIAIGYYAIGGLPAAVDGVVFILLLFACVLLHEFGHALAARRYRVPVPDITLLPIGGVSRITRMPEEPKQELVIALSGLAVNVLIAASLYLVLGRIVDLGEAFRLDDPRIGMLGKLQAVNIGLFLFNLIPAFPMDGGRVLRALLAMRLPYARATQIAASVGQAIAFFFAFIGLFVNPLLIFIGLFVYLAAAQEAAVAQMKDITQRLPVSSAMVTEFTALPPAATLSDAIEALLSTAQHEFPVVDEQGRVIGLLTRDDLIAGLQRTGPDTPVTRVMRRDIPGVSPQSPLDEAFELMQQSESPILAVTDEYGRLVGLITPENVGKMVMIHGALGGAQPTAPALGPRIAGARRVA